MMTSRRILAGMLGVLILTGCDNFSTNLSQADQKELGTLRTEKKTWESEKAQMQESLTLKENEKNEAIAERDQLREELKALQDKQASDSEAKPEAGEQK
jgi:Skp family chaperone for outer membrane proteins